MIVTPLLAYVLTMILLDLNSQKGWVPITQDMLSPIVEPLLFVKIALTILLIVIIYGLFSLISFILYRILGPSRYGLLDMPPVAYRGKKYRR
jgi:hypothetical protein